MSKGEVSPEEHRCHHSFHWAFVFVPLPGVEEMGTGPKEGIPLVGSSLHTPLSVALHFHSLSPFATSAPQATFSMKETGKIAENNPIPIRLTLHNKHLFGHCLDCHFSENLLFD